MKKNKNKNNKTPSSITVEVYNHNGLLLYQENLVPGLIYFYGIARIKQKFDNNKNVIKQIPKFTY